MKGRQSTGVHSPWGEEPSLAWQFLSHCLEQHTGRTALTLHPVPLVRPANPITDLAFIHHTAAWSSTLWCHSQTWFHDREKAKRQKRLGALWLYSNLLRGAKRRYIFPSEKQHSFSPMDGKAQFWRYPGAPPQGDKQEKGRSAWKRWHQAGHSCPHLATGGRQAGTIWFTLIKRAIFYPLFSL